MAVTKVELLWPYHLLGRWSLSLLPRHLILLGLIQSFLDNLSHLGLGLSAVIVPSPQSRRGSEHLTAVGYHLLLDKGLHSKRSGRVHRFHYCRLGDRHDRLALRSQRQVCGEAHANLRCPAL